MKHPTPWTVHQRKKPKGHKGPCLPVVKDAGGEVVCLSLAGAGLLLRVCEAVNKEGQGHEPAKATE